MSIPAPICSRCQRPVLNLVKKMCRKCYALDRYGPGWQQKYNQRRPPGKYHYPKKHRFKPPAGTPCEICGVEKNIVADHLHGRCKDHGEKQKCGRCFRGWLCRTCNAGLGMFQDHPDVLDKARVYLVSKEEWVESGS